jgi:hypothetical protein
MEETIGKFLDTNVVFDATFELRKNRKNFLNFMKNFKYKELLVETVVTLEAIEIIAETFGLITPIIRNVIFNSDWDNLDDKRKQAVLTEIYNKIKYDEEISKGNRSDFALAEYNVLFPSFLMETKENIQILLRTLPDQYTEHFRMRLEDMFEIFQAYMEDADYNNFNSELKRLNVDKTIFKEKDSNDFKILCSLLSILQFGGQDNTYGEHHEFSNINLYGRDSDFFKNIENFKKIIETNTDNSYINLDHIKEDLKHLLPLHPYQTKT